jgi:hypothetical protein
MPTVWVGKWEGFHNMGRVYGPDLMLEISRLSLARATRNSCMEVSLASPCISKLNSFRPYVRCANN